MEVIGIIAEYNPFHNGHLYQINTVKVLYPDSIIVVILNVIVFGELEIGLYSTITIVIIGKMIDIILEGIDFFGEFRFVNNLGVKQNQAGIWIQ